MAKPRNKSGVNRSRHNDELPELSTDVAQQLGAIEQQLGTLAADYSTLATVGAQTADTTPQIQNNLQQLSGLLQSLTGGLERFEDRLTIRLEDVIREAIAQESTAVSGNASSQVADYRTAEVYEQPSAATETQVAEADPPAPVEESWEAIRKAMLEAAGEAEEAPDELPNKSDQLTGEDLIVAARPVEQEAEVAQSQTQFDEYRPCELSAPMEFDLPQPVDYSLIQDETLRNSVLAMEDLMRTMAEKLRKRIKLVSPISTDQLHELRDVLPEEFRSRVDSSLTLLDEQLRLTELELSLERARVGRQITKLEESERIVRNTASQLGYTLQDDGGLQRTLDEGPNGSTERRWTRVLGFGR